MSIWNWFKSLFGKGDNAGSNADTIRCPKCKCDESPEENTISGGTSGGAYIPGAVDYRWDENYPDVGCHSDGTRDNIGSDSDDSGSDSGGSGDQWSY
jgi:hypothetical protein